MTVLAAVLALVAAGPVAPSAFAQSAGDDQYEDPFAGEDQEPSQGGGEEPAATATPAPAPAEPAPEPAAEATPATPAAEPAPSSQQPELPRTGLDAAAILAIGAVLLGSGIALRVRLRARS
jgi:pyruvate dehydrogenase E2 component (dihydrolipoamide acetyltransferase)